MFDWKGLLLNQLIGLLSGFMLMPSGAQKYVKYLIRARDYLLILVPLAIYPPGSYDEIRARDVSTLAIPRAIPLDGGATVQSGGRKGGRMETRPKKTGARHAKKTR